jgi:hypothetical protein
MLPWIETPPRNTGSRKSQRRDPVHARGEVVPVGRPPSRTIRIMRTTTEARDAVARWQAALDVSRRCRERVERRADEVRAARARADRMIEPRANISADRGL